MLKIIQNRKIYFTISGLFVFISIISLLLWGLKPAIDFTGGTLMEVEFKGERPSNTQIREKLKDLGLDEIQVQPTGERGLLLRLKDIDEQTHQAVLSQLEDLVSKNESAPSNKTEKSTAPTTPTTPAIPATPAAPALTEHQFTSIGPIVGKELKEKTTIAVILVVIGIILYVAIAFRKVSKPVSSWKYGLAAIIALIHDITITCGIFSILGHFLGYEVDVLFVTALLTILGYSVNDTIIVFDRTRENLFRYQGFEFEDTINRSVNETITRSLNTSLTTLLVLFAIYLFGGATIKLFSLALICGIIFGTYSSIFIASPLLVVWEKMRKR